jgi:hypothetical protein
MKTMNRIGMMGLVGAIAGYMLQGCTSQQPQAECSVQTGSELLGVSNYAAVLTKKDVTGTCPDMPLLTVGMTRIHAPGTKDYSIRFRPSQIVDIANGLVYSSDYDATNDCAAYNDTGDCSLCVLTGDDGGLVLGFTGDAVVKEADGGWGVSDGMGGFTDVDITNTCQPEPDGLPRVDPADDGGAGPSHALTGRATIPQYPTNGICAVTPYPGAVDVSVSEDFRAESVDQVFGGTEEFPPVAVKMGFNNMKVVMTSAVQGTMWTADLTYSSTASDAGCVGTYSVLAFWPKISCTTDEDCNPVANLDAGRSTGSGINPAFFPKNSDGSAKFAGSCDATLGICKPLKSVDEILSTK